LANTVVQLVGDALAFRFLRFEQTACECVLLFAAFD
jgi:hypothetical protein